ncbi:UNVERIFIED_CONTAM: hypothetical protein FKN15_048185 [Acipenser sinensis]
MTGAPAPINASDLHFAAAEKRSHPTSSTPPRPAAPASHQSNPVDLGPPSGSPAMCTRAANPHPASTERCSHPPTPPRPATLFLLLPPPSWGPRAPPTGPS